MANLYCCFNLSAVSYFNRRDEEVNRLDLFYAPLVDNHNSHDQAGLLPVVVNVLDSLTFDDFPNLPGIYDVKVRAARGRSGKPEPKLTGVKLLSPLTFDSKTDSYLVFAAKKIEVELTQGSRKGQILKGLKFFAIDPQSPLDSSDARGFDVIEFSKEKARLSDYKLPAYFNAQFSEMRGRGGSAILHADDLNFVSPFNFPKPSSAPNPNP